MLYEPSVEAHQAAQLVPEMARDSLNLESANLLLVQELGAAIHASITAEETSEAEMLKRRSSIFSPSVFNDLTQSVGDLASDAQTKQLTETLTRLLKGSSAAPRGVIQSTIPSTLASTTSTEADALNQILTANASDEDSKESLRMILAPASNFRSPCRTTRASKVVSEPVHTAKKTSAKKGSAMKTRRTSPLPSSIPLPLPVNGPLPMNHKPARGRGRAQQLQSMTQAQIDAEAIAMKEKNRLAARDLRLKRKQREAELEARVAELEAKDLENRERIASLQSKVNSYEGIM